MLPGSSRPRPLFRWLENGLVKEPNRTDVSPSAHGGEELRSVVQFRARPEHDGNTYECFAHNPTFAEEREELGAKVHLVVLCE